MFTIQKDNSVQNFLLYAGDFLYENEPVNSLMLGLSEALSREEGSLRGDPLLLRGIENGRTVLAAIQTPPFNLILSFAASDRIHSLVTYIDSLQINLPGVVGPAKEVKAFAELWALKKQHTFQLGMSQRLYRIDSVLFPVNITGEMRLAEISDLDLIADWVVAFSKESLPPSEVISKEKALLASEKTILNESTHLWINDKKIVTMANATRPTKNGISINAVYTPPEFRRNGYASMLVATLSDKMLKSGKEFCVLYTDLTNPTSNKIYQKIGYKEVIDSVLYLFR